MAEFTNSIGIGSQANIKVLRNGEVIQQLDNCGNQILNSWYGKWGNNYTHQVIENGYLRLGDGVGATTPGMTTLINNVPLKGTTTYGINSTATTSRYYKDIVEGEVNYRIYSTKRFFGYSLGAWVGTLRELGMDSTNNVQPTSKTVDTRIVLPEDVVVTNEDQLIIEYVWNVKVLNEPNTFTISGTFEDQPTDVQVTHTPGPTVNGATVIDNHSGNPSYCCWARDDSPGAPGAIFPTTGSTYGSGLVYNRSYDAANKAIKTQMIITADKINPPSGELRHIVIDSASHHSKWSFNPGIPKTNQDIVKMTFVTKLEPL